MAAGRARSRLRWRYRRDEVPLDGSGPPEVIAKQRGDIDQPVITPDGRFALLAAGGDAPGQILRAIALRPPFASTVLLTSPGTIINAHVSPDAG